MKNLNAVLMIFACLFALTACVEDGSYYNDGYYSTASQPAYPTPVNSGYNRDYQPPRPPVTQNQGYSSTAQNPAPAMPPVSAPVRAPMPSQGQALAPVSARSPQPALPPAPARPSSFSHAAITGKGYFASVLAKVPTPTAQPQASAGYSSSASS